MSLLDDIASIIGDAVPGAGLTRSAVLIKTTEGIPMPGQVSGGSNPTFASYAAQGIVGDYSAYEMRDTKIHAGDRKIRLFATTIAGRVVPVPGDRITIEGATYVIVGPIERDAAGATFVCQCRG